jgi:hypothetical protein
MISMRLNTLSIAALSLAMMGGAAIAEPADSGAYRPGAPGAVLTDPAVDTMYTGSIATNPPVLLQNGNDTRAQTSREGGGEPSAVDPLSPSVVAK